jgi:hypothetical protein
MMRQNSQWHENEEDIEVAREEKPFERCKPGWLALCVNEGDYARSSRGAVQQGGGLSCWHLDKLLSLALMR